MTLQTQELTFDVQTSRQRSGGDDKRLQFRALILDEQGFLGEPFEPVDEGPDSRSVSIRYDGCSTSRTRCIYKEISPNNLGDVPPRRLKLTLDVNRALATAWRPRCATTSRSTRWL